MDKSPGGTGGHCVCHRLRPPLCGEGQPGPGPGHRPALHPHREKRQLPFYPGPVPGCPGQGNTPLSGDREHGIYHQPAEKEPGCFLSSGIHHTQGYYQRRAGRIGCQGFLHEDLASDCLPQG